MVEEGNISSGDSSAAVPPVPDFTLSEGPAHVSTPAVEFIAPTPLSVLTGGEALQDSSGPEEGGIANAEDAQLLRQRHYADQVRVVGNHMLLLLLAQTALLVLLNVLDLGKSTLNTPTGETPFQALISTVLWMAALFAWPLVVLALLRFLHWPQLLRSAGLAVLAATTGRQVIVTLAHLAAVAAAGARLEGQTLWILADPFAWGIAIGGVALCVRAWRLAAEAHTIFPQQAAAVPFARQAWARPLMVLTVIYGLAFVCFCGYSRYQMSNYLLQPGIDPVREQQALQALNEGAALANKGDLAAAEHALQRSLRLWEDLTAGRSTPPVYRANLAQTLYNLAWIRDRQGRVDEAEVYYARTVSVGDAVANDPQVDDQFRNTLALAHAVLAELHGGKSLKDLDEKDKTANRKYEEALVKTQKGDAQAEGLYREAIALWEDVLPRAANLDYRQDTVARLALCYLRLGGLLQQQQGKQGEAEQAFTKAIDYGEKAVALAPDRPTVKHNLELSRQMLVGVQEQAHQEKIDKLCIAERYVDAIDECLRGIKEQEERMKSGKDGETSALLLAYRHNRLAALLAHCPEGHGRDTKAAVTHALQATKLQPAVRDYWYTLAVVQYRNGAWGKCLDALEVLKKKENGFDASGWFLTAMSLHQLKQRDKARAAYQKGVEWINEAMGNEVLLIQYLRMKDAIETLRQEAKNLLEGKDPGGEKVG
jgi:tetratricopeptide (TPR) repeat protein